MSLRRFVKRKPPFLRILAVGELIKRQIRQPGSKLQELIHGLVFEVSKGLCKCSETDFVQDAVSFALGEARRHIGFVDSPPNTLIIAQAVTLPEDVLYSHLLTMLDRFR